MFPYLDSNGKIPMYGIMMVLGFAISSVLLIFLKTNTDIKREDRIYAGCFAIAGGILGAKLASIFGSLNYIIANNIPLVDVIKNGFVFYGGLIGGALSIAIYALIYKINIFSLFDTLAVAVPAGHLFGRIGCFCSGCCFGVHTDSLLGVTYTNPVDPNCPIGTPLLPTQLFESGYCLIIFVVLLILGRKPRKKGTLTTIYALSYSVCRFINEFFRGDQNGIFLNLTVAQLTSIIIVISTITLIIVFYIKNKRKKECIES